MTKIKKEKKKVTSNGGDVQKKGGRTDRRREAAAEAQTTPRPQLAIRLSNEVWQKIDLERLISVVSWSTQGGTGARIST
jgi:hypothetical protein